MWPACKVKNKQNPVGKTAGLVGVFTTYNYLADGTKVRTVAAGDSVDYDDGIQYNNSTMNFIATAEGRADNVDGVSKYKYNYNLTDHLGNVRVTLERNTSNWNVRIVDQEDEYYSFGLRNNKRIISTTNNRYLYNGKEIQTQLANQYDYGARFYDPVIARWTVVDPATEVNRRWSPYGYVKNSPVNRIDPDGMIDYVPGASEAADAAYEAKVAKTQAEADRFVDSHLGAIFGVSSGSNSTSSSTSSFASAINWDSAEEDDSKNKAGTNQRGEKPLTHAQELAKYGQIVFVTNFSISRSYVGGVTYERGTIITDHGWNQDYETTSVGYGYGWSIGINFGPIFPVGNNKPTFSDWKGYSYNGISISYDMISLSTGANNSYRSVTEGLSVGGGYKKYKGNGSYTPVTSTYLIGKPYKNKQQDIDFTTLYIQSYGQH